MGLGIILIIYIIGIFLQKLGVMLDRKYFKIYKNMSRRILKGEIDTKYK